jgi:nucleoporin NUP82
VAVAVPNDVYLTYSIFMLTSAMRVTSLPLILRPESPYNPQKSPPPAEQETKSPELPVPEGTPRAYISLLEVEPYVIPPILSRPMGLPSNPRLVLPASERNSEFKLTPDTLRFMGQMVEHLRSQISEVQLAQVSADARSMVQSQEFQRQAQKCRQIVGFVENMKGKRQALARERLEKIKELQTVLLTRLDRTLQGLMRKASPELSENETKWFEELKRMKSEVLGSSKYDENALRSRAKLVSDLLCFT